MKVNLFKAVGLLMFFSFNAIYINAQSTYTEDEEVKEKYSIYSFTIGLAQEFPGGDLKDRFGKSMKFTLGAQYFTTKNYLFEFDFNFMYGNEVKEDVLSGLRNSNGLIISQNGGLTDIYMRQRGMFLGGIFGKVFSFNDTQSGIRLSGGAGILSHNIRIVDETNGVPQASGDYLKGYDRLTRGLALKQQLGYEIHSENGRINLNLLFEVTQAFTNSVREYQFDIGKVTEGNRLDLLYSIRVNWMLPLKRISTIDKLIYY